MRNQSRRPGRRSAFAAVATALAILSLLFTGSGNAVLVGLQASVAHSSRTVETRTYPTYNANGSLGASQTWRVVGGLGDCCENYFGITPSGRLLNLGGESIYYTDDRGVNWTRVTPSTSFFIGAEGGVVGAPNGDIVGATWDPYSGDRVVSYKYVKSEDKWYFADAQLHTPFSDRPWVGLLPGPFTIGAVTVPYITTFGGGDGKNELRYYSLDGLTYSLPNAAIGEALPNLSTSKWLDLPADPTADAVQPQVHSQIVPLAGGGALSYGLPVNGCGWRILDALNRWSCFTYGDGTHPTFEARMATDSKGRIHELIADDATTFIYRMSSDGGRTWSAITLTMPAGTMIDDYDLKASGAANVTAVAVHGHNPGVDKDWDVLFKVSTATSTPVVSRIYKVGDGNANFGSFFSLGTGARFDFTTLAIFPDGKVAVSFADASHSAPAVAIEP